MSNTVVGQFLSKMESVFGPAGGDQRNMRGSLNRSEEDSDIFDGNSIHVSYPGWNQKAHSNAKKNKVELKPSSIKDKDVEIIGSKSNILNFLVDSGWNKTDAKRWYKL